MGRKSRAKRERRERGQKPIARILRGHSRSSLLALLEAASVSPNASQYLPSLTVAFESLIAHDRLGDKPADVSLLEPLMGAVNDECVSIADQEDFLPHDPRLDVRVPWSGEVFRMAPGGLERPTSDVEMLRRLGLLTDPVLRERVGYGLADLVELVLRRVDAVVQSLAAVWAIDLVPELGSRPGMSQEEIAAAAGVPSIAYQVAQCSNPRRARAALEAHSVSVDAIRREQRSRTGAPAAVIAVRSGRGGLTAVPAGIMVDSLNLLAGTLVSKSLSLDPSLESKWQEVVSGFVGHMFAGAGNSVMGPLSGERCPHQHSVIRYTDSQYLVVGVATGLSRRRLDGAIRSAVSCLDAVRPGSSLRTGNGVVAIPNSAKLCRLLIVAHPQGAIPLTLDGTNCAAITLQDWDWIRRTIGRDEIDLWYFVRDLVEQPRMGQVLSSDGIDLWEVWRNNGKSFYRGARELDVVYVQPHHSAVEWSTASDQRHIEVSLSILGLGSVCMWPLHELEGTSPMIGNIVTNDVYRLVVCATPVAVALLPHSGTEPFPSLAHDLGDCIAYKLECTERQFTGLMAASRRRSLRIEFAFEDSAQCRSVRIDKFEDDVLIFGCTPDLVDLFQEDSRSIEAQIGRLLAEAIAGRVGGTDEFVDAWCDSPPGIRFDMRTMTEAELAAEGAKPDRIESRYAVRLIEERNARAA